MDFDLYADETEVIQCPHCGDNFWSEDIECIDKQIEIDNMIEDDHKGILTCTNSDCKKKFYFEGFIEYRYASKKLESENE